MRNNQIELAKKLLESKGYKVTRLSESDRWQFKVTTTYPDRPTETEFFSANSEEEIKKKHAEYLQNAGENEEVSDPFPVKDTSAS